MGWEKNIKKKGGAGIRFESQIPQAMMRMLMWRRQRGIAMGTGEMGEQAGKNAGAKPP